MEADQPVDKGTEGGIETKPLVNRVIRAEISDVDKLWDIIKGGTNKYSFASSGYVVAGPAMGNLGGAPKISYLGDTLSLKIDLNKNGGGGFYQAISEDVLRKKLSQISPNLEVDGVNVYLNDEKGRRRIAYKDSSAGFIWQDEAQAVKSARELESQLVLATRIYAAYATAYYEENKLAVPGDLVRIGPQEFEKYQKSLSRQASGEIDNPFLAVKPETTFEDIGGQDEAVALCRRFAEQLRYPEVFALQGSKPPRGILLYGPPGTGKTMLAKAMAHEADAEFMHVKAEDVSGQGLYGQSEQAVSGIFTAARQANAVGKHVIVFLDEGDLLLPGKTASRGGRHEATGKTVGIFAQEMDGLVSSPKITLVISTNDPQDIDPRILSRMDEMAGLNLPSPEGIARIMKLHFEKIERSVGHKLVDEAVYSGQLPSLAYSEEMSGRDVADAIGMLIRQRGQIQLSKIREAIESGRIAKNKEEDEASAIGRVARALLAGIDDGLDYLKLPPIKPEELRRALLTSKGLNRKKEEVRFGFLARIPYKDSGNSLRAPYARIGGETRLIE